MTDLENRSSLQPEEPSRELRAAARCAEVLVALVFVLTIATLALNKAVSRNWAETDARYQWYEDTGSMLARFRAFRDHSPRFFEGLVMSALTRSPVSDQTKDRYPSLVALVESGPISISRRPADGSVFDIRGGATSPDLLHELGDAATEFGGLAAKILQDESDPSRRGPLLTAAVGQTFENEDARRFLQEEVVPALARIDDPSQWRPNRKSAWIVFGEWPPAVSGILRPVPGGSYANRYFPSADLESEKRFMLQLVGGTTDATELERILDTSWRDAFGRLKNTPTGDPQIGVPGSGMSFSATDIVMLGGPLLVLIQAFFAMFWIRHWSNHADANAAAVHLEPPAVRSRVFIFPLFANPFDPLSLPIPRTVVDLTQRLIWFLCLLLPVCVLSLALITRYDLSGVTRTAIHHGDDFPMNAMVPGEWLPPGSPMLARLSALRDDDALSIALDALNMVALLVSLMLLIEIVTVNRLSSPRRHTTLIRRTFLVGVCLWVISIWLWAVRLDQFSPLLFGWISPAGLVFWLSFGLTWAVGGFASLSRRARLPLTASIVGLIVLVMLLRPGG